MNRPFHVLAVLGLVLSGLGLTGCNQEDKSPVRPVAEGKGSARLALPALPAGYMPATGLKMPAGQKALFALTISGDGMDPIRRSWVLSPGSQPSVTVEGIPAGQMRTFEGRLIRIDSTGGDTTVTHEGAESAYISRDAVAEVRLFLREGGSGKAHVCVMVEGWPMDSSCYIPPVDSLPHVDGCWIIEVVKKGPKKDTVFTGNLRIDQFDRVIRSRIFWYSSVDSAMGEVFPGGTVYLGLNGGTHLFKSSLDSAGRLTGWFSDSARGIEGFATAWSVECDTTNRFVRSCFDFKQNLNQGKSGSGTLAIETWGDDRASTYFHWDGFATSYAISDILHGSLQDSAQVRAGFSPPPGMFPASLKIDSAAYNLTLTQGNSSGSILQVGGKNDGGKLGNWFGTRRECRSEDFEL